MNDGFRSVYDILDAYRQRPAMFVGNHGRNCPFAALQAFLGGLSFADVDPGDPPFWEFSRWITSRVEGISTNLPWDWLAERGGEGRAYSEFFEYLAEYRQCKVVSVAMAVGETPSPRFYQVGPAGERVTPTLPLSLFVGRYYPSSVYFLGEEYADSSEKNFPYHRSRVAVIAEARDRWGISAAAWRDA